MDLTTSTDLAADLDKFMPRPSMSQLAAEFHVGRAYTDA